MKVNNRKNSLLMTKIEQALLDAGVDETYIRSLATRKTQVDLSPVFYNGIKEFCVHLTNHPEHILGLFRTPKVARAFIRLYGLNLNYDGVFE